MLQVENINISQQHTEHSNTKWHIWYIHTDQINVRGKKKKDEVKKEEEKEYD
jgi:hypothetical protein